MCRTPSSPHLQRGFTLMELAIVLVLCGLMTGIMLSYKQYANAPDCYANTRLQMAGIQGAIDNFVLHNDRYPIPAKRALGVEDIKYGREAAVSDITVSGTSPNEVLYGALPFQALGIPADYAADCWGNKFTYAVTRNLTDSTNFNSSAPFYDGVLNIGTGFGSNLAASKIAYAVISHGEDGLGAIARNGVSGSWCSFTSGTVKTYNCAATDTTLMNAPFNNGKDAGASYFDDLIVFKGRPESIITSSPAIYCWGENGGMHGNGSTGNVPAPTLPVILPSGVMFTLVAPGYKHNCALGNNGDVYCWGDNSVGQLGLGSLTPASTTKPTSPIVKPAGVTKFVNLISGSYHACAIADTGDTYCWGYNGSGQLGRGTTSTSESLPSAVLPTAGVHFLSLSAAWDHTCGIADNNKAYCWGSNMDGKLGNPALPFASLKPDLKVIEPGGVGNFIQIQVGYHHSCALADNGNVYCWGKNDVGQLGDGSAVPSRPKPTSPITKPAGVSSFTSLSTGWSHNCSLGNNGNAYCWGRNDSGQLGLGSSSTFVSQPTTRVTPPAGVSKFTSLTIGNWHSCGYGDNSKVYCWGWNAFGQLANASSPFADHPTTAVPMPTGFSYFSNVTAGGAYNCSVANP